MEENTKMIEKVIGGTVGSLMNKKQKEMLKLRQKALTCSISQVVWVNGEGYTLNVAGAEPKQTIKGFKDFKKICLKDLK